jgi:threonine/homoserine/homoserine lactone efflux protein
MNKHCSEHPMDFLPSLPVLAAYLAAVLVITFTPGPDMTLFLGKAVRQGRAWGIAAMLGATTGVMVHTTLVAVGLSALLAASATAFLVLKVVGALYLLWLAVDAVRHGSALNIEAGRAGAVQETLFSAWAKGLGVNLLNPKIIMFFVTFLPQFVTVGDPAAPGQLFFLGIEFILVSIPLAILTVLAAGWLADAFRRTKWIERALNWSFAAIFTAFAATILFAEAKK